VECDIRTIQHFFCSDEAALCEKICRKAQEIFDGAEDRQGSVSSFWYLETGDETKKKKEEEEEEEEEEKEEKKEEVKKEAYRAPPDHRSDHPRSST
jgi:hypothetical protein